MPLRSRSPLGSLLALVLASCVTRTTVTSPDLPHEMVGGEPMYAAQERDRMLALDEPARVSAEDASAWMADGEPVVGVVGRAGTARAYPALYLEVHGVVNDVLDGEPILVVWDPLARAGVARSRRVDGGDEPLAFGVTGRIWHGTIVLYDRATDSRWSPMTGRAIDGPRAGDELAPIPATVTSWSSWRALHPSTQVVEKPASERGRTESWYAAYHADPRWLYFPDLARGIAWIEPKQPVYGLVVGGEPFAAAESLVREDGVVHAVVGGRPIALVDDPRTGFAAAYDTGAPGGARVLARGAEGAVDSVTGEPVDLASLERLHVERMAYYAWARLHPETIVVAR